MRPKKNATELGFEYLREAHVERVCKPHPVLAEVWERSADEVLTLANPPDVGAGGEVVGTNSLPDLHMNQVAPAGVKRLNIRDTLGEGATRIAEDASVQRADFLRQPSFGVLPMAIRKLPRQVDSSKLEFPRRAIARGSALAAGSLAHRAV